MKFFQSIGKLVLGLVGLIVVLVIVIALFSGGGDKPTVKSGDGQKKEATVAKIGDTVTVGDWEYTFTKARTA